MSFDWVIDTFIIDYFAKDNSCFRIVKELGIIIIDFAGNCTSVRMVAGRRASVYTVVGHIASIAIIPN